jgi:hypothetical protein
MNKRIMVFLCLCIGVLLGSGAAYIGYAGLYSIQNQAKYDERTEVKQTDMKEEIDSTQDDKKAIEDVYHAMYQYELTKDVEHLSDILSDDYVLIHMTGLRQSKAEYLRCVRDGELNYFSEETHHVSVDLQGEKALLTGQSRVNAAVFGGSRHTWPLQLVISMEKKNGKWLMVEAKASTY